VLLILESGPKSTTEVLSALGLRTKTEKRDEEDVVPVTHGSIWNILDRARHNGLVSRSSSKDGPIAYSLTNGGKRRVAWIKRKVGR
jgi:DNA-binding PadR family transcriptional regulator